MNHSEREYDWCYRVLEIEPGAALIQVRAAYQRLMELYDGDSLATSALVEEDLSEERRQEILANVKAAYEKLMGLYEKSGGEGFEAAPPPEVDEYTGAALRQRRENLGIRRREVEVAIKIRAGHIENIEDENFKALPPEVFLKGYLATYARHLSLDHNRVVREYMDRYYRAMRGS